MHHSDDLADRLSLTGWEKETLTAFLQRQGWPGLWRLCATVLEDLSVIATGRHQQGPPYANRRSYPLLEAWLRERSYEHILATTEGAIVRRRWRLMQEFGDRAPFDRLGSADGITWRVAITDLTIMAPEREAAPASCVEVCLTVALTNEGSTAAYCPSAKDFAIRLPRGDRQRCRPVPGDPAAEDWVERHGLGWRRLAVTLPAGTPMIVLIAADGLSALRIERPIPAHPRG